MDRWPRFMVLALVVVVAERDAGSEGPVPTEASSSLLSKKMSQGQLLIQKKKDVNLSTWPPNASRFDAWELDYMMDGGPQDSAATTAATVAKDNGEAYYSTNFTSATGSAALGTAAGSYANASGNGTAGGIYGLGNVSGSVNGTCVTREEPRAVVIGYTTAEPGTQCMFGVDDRDEGFHCIMDDGKYGSYGWCYTDKDAESWGSCSEGCPLFGPPKVLAGKIESLRSQMKDSQADLMGQMENLSAAVKALDNLTNTSNATATADAGVAPATALEPPVTPGTATAAPTAAEATAAPTAAEAPATTAAPPPDV